MSVFCQMSFSFLFEVSQQTVRNNPSSYQIKAVAAAVVVVVASSDCRMASSFTCMSARRRVETLDSTARTRPQPHVRRTHLDGSDHDDDTDTCMLFCMKKHYICNIYLFCSYLYSVLSCCTNLRQAHSFLKVKSSMKHFSSMKTLINKYHYFCLH